MLVRKPLKASSGAGSFGYMSARVSARLGSPVNSLPCTSVCLALDSVWPGNADVGPQEVTWKSGAEWAAFHLPSLPGSASPLSPPQESKAGP